MDKTGWTTHCFGRFLVDLPPQAKIGETYKIWGDEIKRLYETPESLATMLNERERELKAQKHETEGSMFIHRTKHDSYSVSLLSWKRPYSKVLMWKDSFFVTNSQRQIFQYSGEVSPSKQQSALGFADTLARNIRSRSPNGIPTGPGYCIDGGFIAGNDYRAESFTVDVKLPLHPGAFIEIFASTGAEEDTLLDRVDGFFQTAVAGPVAGLKTLRKAKRNVGPIQAEEYAVAGSGQGQRVYSFAWESQGKDDTLAEPNLGVKLDVLGQSVVTEKEPYKPAFQSDEEALELWDAIIESIRLRPGAA